MAKHIQEIGTLSETWPGFAPDHLIDVIGATTAIEPMSEYKFSTWENRKHIGLVECTRR
jgi:hypothetical protein